MSSPPSKRCKVCHQTAPATPRLPREIVDKILSMLPFEQYAAVVGACDAVRRKALCRPDWYLYYYKHAPQDYDPATDNVLAAHWNIAPDDPARPFVAQLCSFGTANLAQQFFNSCVPRAVARQMLNAPRRETDLLLCSRWEWWRLARKLIAHENANGRTCKPARVHVWSDCNYSETHNIVIFDVKWDSLNAQPDFVATVRFDYGLPIELHVGLVYVSRIIK